MDGFYFSYSTTKVLLIFASDFLHQACWHQCDANIRIPLYGTTVYYTMAVGPDLFSALARIAGKTSSAERYLNKQAALLTQLMKNYIGTLQSM